MNCQKNIEGESKCEKQCEHCNKYYAPINHKPNEYGLVKGNLEILPYWNDGKIQYHYLQLSTPAFDIILTQGSEMHCTDIYSEIVALD